MSRSSFKARFQMIAPIAVFRVCAACQWIPAEEGDSGWGCRVTRPAQARRADTHPAGALER